MEVTVLRQNGRRVDGLLGFGPEPNNALQFATTKASGIKVDEPSRMRVKLERYTLDADCGESSFELEIPGYIVGTFTGTVERYEYHPATGLSALIVLSSELEFRDVSQSQKPISRAATRDEAAARWPNHELVDTTTLSGPYSFAQGLPKDRS